MGKKILLIVCLLCLHIQFAAIHANNATLLPEGAKDACIISVPKAFSPNGDGFNDKFIVKNACNIDEFSLKIFTAENLLVHETERVEKAWDGKWGARPAPEGKYEWIISYKKKNDQETNLKGSVVLVR